MLLFTLAVYAQPSTPQLTDKDPVGYAVAVSRSNNTPENKTLAITEALEAARTADQKKAILKEAGKTHTFQSLLLAGKYLDDPGKDVAQEAAVAVKDIALSNKSFYGPEIRSILSKAMSVIKGKAGRDALMNHLIEIPTYGGFVSMFNGKDLTGWKGLVENPVKRRNMSADELARKQEAADVLMHKNWKVKDGVLQFTGDGYDNLCSVKQYGNFEMYVDWMIEPKGDAGVYLRGTPQVQIWDTSRTDVGAEVGSGGLYNNRIHNSKPSKVMDNQVGKWNTFYIKMVDDRVTVIFNGEKVVDNVVLENSWDRTKSIFPVEQLELQAHGTLVSWRNIYIKELPSKEAFRLLADEIKEGYQILFDGSNLDKWTGNIRDYTIEYGALTLYPPVVDNKPEGGGNLYTKDEFGDFILRFEFQLTPGANNGLGIRTPMEGDAAYVGMELQILDNDAPVYANLEPQQYHGSVYGVIPAKRGFLKPAGEWNYQEVYVRGDNIEVTLNGTVILAGNIREASKNGTIDGREHPGLLNKSGHIGFLGHGSEVRFKNIRVKRL